jgi:hypothetical protein
VTPGEERARNEIRRGNSTGSLAFLPCARLTSRRAEGCRYVSSQECVCVLLWCPSCIYTVRYGAGPHVPSHTRTCLMILGVGWGGRDGGFNARPAAKDFLRVGRDLSEWNVNDSETALHLIVCMALHLNGCPRYDLRLDIEMFWAPYFHGKSFFLKLSVGGKYRLRRQGGLLVFW